MNGHDRLHTNILEPVPTLKASAAVHQRAASSLLCRLLGKASRQHEVQLVSTLVHTSERSTEAVGRAYSRHAYCRAVVRSRSSR